MISIIVATSLNNVIGKDNTIPWNLPTDMKFFKEKTLNHTVIMGRKCWESIPEKFRPLPKRTNIVITRDVDYIANGAEISHNLIELLEKYKDTDDEIFVIGGAEIYKEAFKYASKFYLTRIFEEIDGDIFLEGFDINEWKWIDSSDMSEENSYKFRFEFYSKIYEL